MFMYWSGEGVLAVHGRSCISNNASHYIRLTSTSSLSRNAGTNNSSSLFSHQLQRRGHPGAIITSGGAYIQPDWRCQVLGLALCRNALPRPDAARITVVSEQPAATSYEALAASCAQAGSLLFLCLLVYVHPARFWLHGSTWVRHRPDLPLLWGIALPCVWRLVTAANTGEAEKRGNPYKDEKKRVGGLCECRCVWTPWVFISFPEILHFSSATRPRGSQQTQPCEICIPFCFTPSRSYRFSVFSVKNGCAACRLIRFTKMHHHNRRSIKCGAGPVDGWESIYFSFWKIL